MVLQSSGAISLANIQTEFGGANPIGLNEYYLNGAYTTGSGATGVPTSGQISLGSFYSKSKITGSAWLPTAVQSDYNIFGLPWGIGYTYYFWQNGASGTNNTRTGGTTFNNIGSGYQLRSNFINYQSLILQCMPGDTLGFQMSTGAIDSYFTHACILLNLGSGWFLVAPPYGNGSYTVSATYTVPSSTAPGNYGIAVYCDYDHAASVSYSSASFYSLHVVNSYAPTAVQSDYNLFGKPWGTVDTYYLWQNGASGTNLTRTNGLTFNNLGSDGQNRASFINYQSLILQAKPGDVLSFQLRNGALAGYQIVNSLLLHLGGGWFVAGSATSNGARTDTINYTVSSSLAPGNYGIIIYCDYWGQNNGYYASANFYSLQIAN